ncbi:MAG: NAD+ synthase, partial [Euryarchaeota archaeon]|nr:NAD+ synthase [Euryarchaeota archaeon]
QGGVLGLSGGVDSALTAFLAKEALGERLRALIMPERDVTPEQDVRDAVEVAERLEMRYEVVEIGDVVDAVRRTFPVSAFTCLRPKLADANIKPRVRMLLLYLASNLDNLLVIGTGNRTELLLGYFTKYGDGGVDLLPIGGLYKTQVRALARYVGVPERIVRKPPSAGLWAGQRDEEELGLSYEVLDAVLHSVYDLGRSPEETAEALGLAPEDVRRVVDMVRANSHKLSTPKIAKIPWRA